MQNAGIVDENIEAAEVFDGLCDSVLHGFRIGAVGPDRQRLAAGCLDLGDDRLRLVLANSNR